MQQTEKLPEKAKTQLIQEQKPPPSELTKTVVETSTPPARAAPVTNSETTVESKVCKPVEIEVKPQESKELENKEISSVSPMETDPLATDKEEVSSNSTTEQSTGFVENIENQAPVAGGQNQEESFEPSQGKSSNENIQEAESTEQSVATKSNEPPVSISISNFFL